MRIKVALVFSSLLVSAGGFTAADATLVAQQGEYTPYDYFGSTVLCKTRTNDKNVKQIKWAPVYQMSGDENHQAVKIYVKVRVEMADNVKNKGPWAIGKKAPVTPGEPFSKYRRAWTPWVGVKRDRSLLVHVVWHRTTSDYVVKQRLTEIPTAGSEECKAV